MLSALLPLLVGATLVGLATVLLLKPALVPQNGSNFPDYSTPILHSGSNAVLTASQPQDSSMLLSDGQPNAVPATTTTAASIKVSLQ